MNLLPSTDWPLWINGLIFAAGAIGVWLSGSQLSNYVELIAERSRMGEAFAGALLLGVATSLPEIATTFTASSRGAATMAGTNLLGGLVMQVAVLAAMDWLVLRHKPITLFAPSATLLMQGVILIGLIALAIAAIACGEIAPIGWVGTWPIAIFACYAFSVFSAYRYEKRVQWEPSGEIEQPPQSAKEVRKIMSQKYESLGSSGLSVRFLLAAAGVLVFGASVALAGEAIAEQSGLGQGFVGAVFVALATSLPEVSTTWSALRFGAFSLATANIIGTNSLSVALLLPADLAYREGLILEVLGARGIYLGALGIIATVFFLWGILERRNRTVFGMGIDSAMVLATYVGGMLIYYFYLD